MSCLRERMEQRFETIYGRKPTLHVRCPGRVNLIGEHIDYNGYSVLPMAIEQETVVVAAANDVGLIRIANIDDKYKSFSMSLPSGWAGAAPPDWHDYFLCGWRGVVDRLAKQDKDCQQGFDVLMGGTIPASSGLSSSSSMVCAAALTTWVLYTGKGFDGITREELADLCAAAERFVGTQGGGMDQAAEVLAVAGQTLRIDFNPLSSRAISVPERARFVVLHCGDTLNKAATNQYNQRVVECRLAGKWLLSSAGLACDSLRLKDVQHVLGKSLAEMVSMAEDLPEVASRQQLDDVIGRDTAEHCLSDNTRHLTSFVLRSRARHVFSEALRVDQMIEACSEGNIEEMGRLMDSSHDSCSKDYECSCASLDALVSSCRSAGVAGVRLTGAGWGGCVVALVDSQKEPQLAHLNLLFTSRPSNGISYTQL